MKARTSIVEGTMISTTPHPIEALIGLRVTAEEAIAGGTEGQGRFLCEQCYDAFTDYVLCASKSDSGLEEACCDACYRARQVRKG